MNQYAYYGLPFAKMNELTDMSLLIFKFDGLIKANGSHGYQCQCKLILSDYVNFEFINHNQRSSSLHPPHTLYTPLEPLTASLSFVFLLATDTSP